MGYNDPVISDLGRHLAELDAIDARQTAIYEDAVRLQEDEMGEVLAELYESDLLVKEYEAALRVICMAKSSASQRMACDDLQATIHEAAMRLSKRNYDNARRMFA